MAVQDDDDDDEQVGKADADGAARKKRPKKKKKKKDQEDGDEAQPTTSPSPSPSTAPPTGPTAQDCEEEEPTEEWVDITDTCDLAVEAMHIGEMIASPHFRLFDAMSAVEIMDPKMDSGYKNNEDMTIEKAKASGIVKAKLSHEELITIWDQLLMYYLMWLEGHTIVQTCFCCLYLQDLEWLKKVPLMGAFVDAYLHAIRQAWNIVLKASVFDDEDFMPNMFNIDIDHSLVFSAKPGEIWQRISKELTALKKTSSESVEAVAWRLQFIGEYMLALCDAEASPEKNGKKGAAQQRLTTCLELVQKLGQSARPPVEDALRCFDASFNRKLLVPGPPRTVEPIKDSQKVLAMWTSHIHELQLCGELGDKSLTQLLEGAITWKDEPNILPRSIALLHVSEEPFLAKLTYESLSLFLFPEEAMAHCKKASEAFLQRVQSLFAHMMKQTHANRARRFRRLAHVFPDFNALQHEALALDEKLKSTFGANLRYPRPCWVWIMEYCLEAMLTKLFLGFYLELYDPAEYHMIYWYADYLFGLRIYSLNELHHAKEQPVGGGGSKRRPKAQAAPKGSTKPRNPPPSLLFLDATQATVRGLFRLLAFCLRRDLLSGSPPSVAEGLAQRFVLRFRSLEQFRLPHLPSFSDFEKSSASTQAPVDSRVVLEAAQSSFADATHFLDKFAAIRDKGEQPYRGGEPCASVSPAEEAKAMRKVIIANQVTISQLLKGLGGEKTMPKVAVTTQHHPYLASVQVVAD